jgi:LPXTG-motif cell wall-anchored protein
VTDASRHSFATVPTNTPGTYQVSYSATDPNSGYVYRQVASVTILPSKTTVNVADQNLIAGPKTTWQPADSFVSATNETGQSVDLADMTVSGADQVDLTTPGQYPVTYAYTDALNNVVQQTAQVNVAATKASIQTGAVTLIAGPKTSWQPEDSLLSATDATGQALAVSALTVTGHDQVDPQLPGTYPLKYQYVDQAGNSITQQATVKVVASAASLTAKDSQITAGQNWQPNDNFVSGTDASGQPITFEQGITTTGQVNATQAGTYPVTYRYRDIAGNEIARTVAVTVLSQAESATPTTDPIILPKTEQPASLTTTRVSILDNQVVQNTKSVASQLPKTGEQIDNKLVVVGLILLCLGSLYPMIETKQRDF